MYTLIVDGRVHTERVWIVGGRVYTVDVCMVHSKS